MCDGGHTCQLLSEIDVGLGGNQHFPAVMSGGAEQRSTGVNLSRLLGQSFQCLITFHGTCMKTKWKIDTRKLLFRLRNVLFFAEELFP